MQDDEYSDLRKAWSMLAEIVDERGVDLATSSQLWADGKEADVRPCLAGFEFEELCSAGCSPISLGMAIQAMGMLPSIVGMDRSFRA